MEHRFVGDVRVGLVLCFSVALCFLSSSELWAQEAAGKVRSIKRVGLVIQSGDAVAETGETWNDALRAGGAKVMPFREVRQRLAAFRGHSTLPVTTNEVEQLRRRLGLDMIVRVDVQALDNEWRQIVITTHGRSQVLSRSVRLPEADLVTRVDEVLRGVPTLGLQVSVEQSGVAGKASAPSSYRIYNLARQPRVALGQDAEVSATEETPVEEAQATGTRYRFAAALLLGEKDAYLGMVGGGSGRRGGFVYGSTFGFYGESDTLSGDDDDYRGEALAEVGWHFSVGSLEITPRAAMGLALQGPGDDIEPLFVVRAGLDYSVGPLIYGGGATFDDELRALIYLGLIF